MSVNITADNFEAARAAVAELREMADQIISPRNSPSKLRLQRLARGVEFVVRMAEMADDLAERMDAADETLAVKDQEIDRLKEEWKACDRVAEHWRTVHGEKATEVSRLKLVVEAGDTAIAQLNTGIDSLTDERDEWKAAAMALSRAAGGLLPYLSAHKGDDDQYRLHVRGDLVAAHVAEQTLKAELWAVGNKAVDAAAKGDGE